MHSNIKWQLCVPGVKSRSASAFVALIRHPPTKSNKIIHRFTPLIFRYSHFSQANSFSNAYSSNARNPSNAELNLPWALRVLVRQQPFLTVKLQL